MSTGRPNPGAPTQPSLIDVLALFLATVPLPKPTAAALRLTCKATRLAIDESIKSLTLSAGAAEGLRPVGPLTSGLTSFSLKHGGFTRLSMLAASLIALRNSGSLEVLDCTTDAPYSGDVAAMLGASEWPKLSCLTITALPNIFTDYIDIDSMPNLTKLDLRGEVSGADMTALSRGLCFPSSVRVFTLRCSRYHNDSIRFSSGLSDLLNAASRLQSLILHIFDSIDYLTTADLPNMEYLDIFFFGPDKASLQPVTAISRPRLHTIRLFQVPPSRAHLLPFCHPGSLPALKNLEFLVCDGVDWSFLREISHTSLTSLSFTACDVTVDDIPHIATALARLPALQDLDLSLSGIADEDIDAVLARLLPGPPLPQLRRLEADLQGGDDSLRRLIALADKVPELEEFSMDSGKFSAEGFVALAAAGRRGVWPHLKTLSFGEFIGLNGVTEVLKNDCVSLLQGVWPGLEVDFRGW